MPSAGEKNVYLVVPWPLTREVRDGYLLGDLVVLAGSADEAAAKLPHDGLSRVMNVNASPVFLTKLAERQP